MLDPSSSRVGGPATERLPRHVNGSDRPDAGGEDSGIRLAELVAAFSLATDLGFGQPMEHVLRSWFIAARLAERVGIGTDAKQALYYVITLAMVGCVAETPELAEWFGDDIVFRRDGFDVDLAGLPKRAFAMGHVALRSPPLERVRRGARLAAFGDKALEKILITHCIATGQMADQLGLGSDVSDPLQQVFARWDGKGVPSGLGGESIAIPVRLFHLADGVEVAHRSRGIDAALSLVRGRSGTQLDPSLVDTFCAEAPEVLDGVDAVADWNALIEREPALQQRLTDIELDTALEAIADFTDLRSPPRAGHSRAVAELSARAAQHAGLPKDDVTNVRRAGLVHDLGMHGVPATILDKPGRLTAAESERMRLHAYYTERMLARPPALARIGGVASKVNERLDGSGYHRGLPGAAIPAPARILAAADAYQAMTEPRSHRPALTTTAATAELSAEVRAGRLASEAVEAVLAAAGLRRSKRRSGPGGLTPREVEVLILVARGAATKQVARELGITTKTAGTHIERIYSKIGASSRSTATLFALQQGLLDPFGPPDP
jgi:HD-GYP domain-containing protein (c-di-GMP phosphodiesterase class II)